MMTAIQSPQFLTLDETARLVRCSSDTVRRWVAGGNFPQPVKPGRKWIFRNAEIQDFLASRERRTGGEQ